MTSSATQEHTTTSQQIPDSGDPGQGSTSLIALARETYAIAQEFLALLMLELRLAARSVPMIIALAVVGFLLAIFTWLSFAVGVAWIGATLLNSTGWGIAVFLVVHLLALVACRMAIARYVRNLTLPNSRKFLQDVEANLREPH